MRRCALHLVVAAGLLASDVALAQTAPAAAEDSTAPGVDKARSYFTKGVEAVRAAQWAEALFAFEQSSQLRPHATTLLNIGACERALGHYTRAKRRFEQALARSKEFPSELPESLTNDAKAYVGEIEHLLVRIEITIRPAGARFAIDGRPLEVDDSGGAIAGIAPVGRGQPAPVGPFTVTADPGAHVFTLSRDGYTDAVVNKTFGPGQKALLDLELERLPATLHVRSTLAGALVSVDGIDVGPVPVDLQRPPGGHRIEVRREGFLTYSSEIAVRPGQEVTLEPALAEDRPPITKKWWFWSAIGSAVVGGAVLTYALTRPTPEPPPYDAGNTGWLARPPSK